MYHSVGTISPCGTTNHAFKSLQRFTLILAAATGLLPNIVVAHHGIVTLALSSQSTTTDSIKIRTTSADCTRKILSNANSPEGAKRICTTTG
jgi:hypothetical protein